MICIKCGTALPDEANFCYMCGKALRPAKKTPQKKRPNSTGYVRQRPDGRWVAVYPLEAYATEDKKNHRPTISKGGFTSKTQALEYLPELKKKRAQIEAEKNNQPVVKPELTFNHFLELYRDSSKYQKLSESKQQQYGYAMDKIEAAMGDCCITSKTTSQLERFCRDKGKTYYPSRDIKTVLSHLYDLAARDDASIINPTHKIDLAVLSGKDVRKNDKFKNDDLEKIWQAYNNGDEMAAYILLTAYTGMMTGELLILNKENIHLDIRQIIGCGLKTQRRRSEPILLCDKIMPVITALYDRAGAYGRILPMSESTFRKKYKEAIERYGITNPNIRPYSGRHTTASALQDAGVDGFTVQDVMRQDDIKMTRRYIDPEKNTTLKTINKVFSDVENDKDKSK